MADRTPAQIGKANREAGKRAERKVAQYLEAHGLGNGAATSPGTHATTATSAPSPTATATGGPSRSRDRVATPAGAGGGVGR